MYALYYIIFSYRPHKPHENAVNYQYTSEYNFYYPPNAPLAYKMSITPSLWTDYEFVYRYYLNRINAYNSKESALFWGRIYYRSLSEIRKESKLNEFTILDIESMINNDIKSMGAD